MNHIAHRVLLKIYPQRGIALPTVLALSMVCSVLLLACWRNITLAQAWSRHHVEQWQLRQAALSALLTTAAAAMHPPLATDADGKQHLHIPTTTEAWNSVHAELPELGCANGVCRSLLDASNRRADWLDRTEGAYTVSNDTGLQLFHWVELLPNHLPKTEWAKPFTYRITVLAVDSQRHTQAGWQAVWQPSAATPLDKPIHLADLQRVLELLP
jgi:hypothetical protein